MSGVGVGVVGRNVRRLRTERPLSLGAVAAQAGLAKQTLANLESGRGNPTVETLLAVSRALGVGATWLLAEWGSPVVVQRAGDAAWVDHPGGRRRELDEIVGTGEVVTGVVEPAPRRRRCRPRRRARCCTPASSPVGW